MEPTVLGGYSYVENPGISAKQGDIIKYTITGSFSGDVSDFRISADYSGSYCSGYGSNTIGGRIAKDREVTISGAVVVVASDNSSSYDNLWLYLNYDGEAGSCFFVPRGKVAPKIYEVDLTEYMGIGMARDDSWGSDYHIYFSPKFPAIQTNEGDIIKYTFTGSFSSDVSDLWGSNFRAERIASGEEFTVNGFIKCENGTYESVNLDFYLNYTGELCYFIPKGWTGSLPQIYEIDLTGQTVDVSGVKEKASYSTLTTIPLEITDEDWDNGNGFEELIATVKYLDEKGEEVIPPKWSFWARFCFVDDSGQLAAENQWFPIAENPNIWDMTKGKNWSASSEVDLVWTAKPTKIILLKGSYVGDDCPFDEVEVVSIKFVKKAN